MRTKSRMYQAASVSALVATCALPFWQPLTAIVQAQSPARIPNTAPPTQATPIGADAERVAMGISGYIVEYDAATGRELRIEVVSSAHSAQITMKPVGAGFEVEIVGDETIVVSSRDIGYGGVAVDGRAVAHWEAHESGVFRVVNFDELAAYDTWNTLVATLDDANITPLVGGYQAALWEIVVGGIIAIIGIVVGVIVAYDIAHTQSCTDWDQCCYENDGNMDAPCCQNWMQYCDDYPLHQVYCDQFYDQCQQGSQEACDYFYEYCF